MLRPVKHLPGGAPPAPSPDSSPTRSVARSESLGVSIVIPARNEECTIGRDLDTIRRVMDETAHVYEIVVVDDGSRDRTVPIVLERPWVRLIRRSRHKGVGTARQTGILASRYPIVVTTDADGTYPVQDIPRMLRHMAKYDMVVGARPCEAAAAPLLRSPARWFLRKLAEYVTAIQIPDLHSGLRAFRKELALPFFPILPSRHAWAGTMTLAFLSNDYDVKYIPVDYYARSEKPAFRPVAGVSRFFQFLFGTVIHFRPMKVLLPIVAAIFVLGVAGVLSRGAVRAADVLVFLGGATIGIVALFADLFIKLSKKRSYGWAGHDGGQ